MYFLLPLGHGLFIWGSSEVIVIALRAQ